RIAQPSLHLQKSGPAQAMLYDSLTYRLHVANTGGAEVADVVLSDLLPDGLEHSSHSNKLTWNLGRLAPGQTRMVEYQAIAKSVGRLCNRATVTAAGGIHESAESCVVIAEARLTLAVSGPAARYLNMPAAYRITATNAGTAPLGSVTIVDPLPA